MAPSKPAEEGIFNSARHLASAAERQRYLNEACGDDSGLRARIEALLRVHDDGNRFLQPPVQAPCGSFVEPICEQPGMVIGPYKLLEKIGEGGFGVVFMAEQQQPVRRKVALKVIKPGMDTRQVVARFEAERQALALMSHPNIAHILDGGETASGRPYFVMELVNGVPVTEFCDASHLPIHLRLSLFISVCHAVHHAHQKGIIHRDIKPSNVLVTLRDGTPVVKVIDFGIAKAIGQQLTDKTLFTNFAHMIGTPLYMSPEQAQLSGLDIDTRTDIYSLGVLLYELLTGNTPFDRERLRSATFDEIRRIIREEEPARPSTRINALGDTALAITANRQSDPRRLSQLIRGELDWIVMKCLEKDRARRYDSAAGLARDIQRYLADEPVEASPPSTVYRLRKFLRRNRGPVLVASVIFLLLVAGVVGTATGLVRERRAKETAQKRLAQIEKGIDVLGSIFEDLDPKWEEKEGRPLRALLGDRLDKAAAELEGEAVADPLMVAKLQDRLGATYLALGFPEKAAPLLAKALATREAHLGRNNPDTLSTMNNLGVCRRQTGRWDEALLLHEETLRLRKELLGPDDVDTLTSMNNLATTCMIARKLDRALPLLEETYGLIKAKRGPFHIDTLSSMANLANAYLAAGKLERALSLCKETLELKREHLGPRHIHTLVSMDMLARAYQADRKLGLALPLFEETLKLRQATLGPYNLQTIASMSNLAECYRAANQVNRAVPLHEEATKLMKALRGLDDPDTLLSLNNLAAAYWQNRQLDRSIPLFEEVYRLTKSKRGENDPTALLALANLGVNYKSAGRLPEAVDCLEKAISRIRQLPPLSQAPFGFVPRQLVDGYEKSNLFSKAEPLRREALAAVKEKSGPESVAYATELFGLGSNLLAQKKHAAAEPLVRDCLRILQKQQPDAWATFLTQSNLGGVLLGQQKYAEAEPLLLEGYQGMKKREAQIPNDSRNRLTEALERLVHLYDAWGKPAEADKWRKQLPPGPPQ